MTWLNKPKEEMSFGWWIGSGESLFKILVLSLIKLSSNIHTSDPYDPLWEREEAKEIPLDNQNVIVEESKNQSVSNINAHFPLHLDFKNDKICTKVISDKIEKIKILLYKTVKIYIHDSETEQQLREYCLKVMRDDRNIQITIGKNCLKTGRLPIKVVMKLRALDRFLTPQELNSDFHDLAQKVLFKVSKKAKASITQVIRSLELFQTSEEICFLDCS